MILALTLTSALAGAQTDWRTTYEKSGFVETGRYAEAVDFCKRLDAASESAKLITFGRSPEGRNMVALIVSKERAFTPQDAKKTKKPLVLIINGIHSGEIEGKDSCLILAREILITKRETALIENVNLMIIPVFSVDGHERFGAYNRINQNGPNEMGWRVTSRNLNLNRDFLKADSEEMRAFLRLFHSWKPDLFFDNHTSDGGDWQYDVTYGAPLAPTQDPGIVSWTKAMLAYVESKVTEDGHTIAPYFSTLDTADLTKGIVVSDYSPRYSTGYGAAVDRPTVLVETHMLKPYKQRVEATYSINKRAIEYCGRTARSLKDAIVAADIAHLAGGSARSMVLTATRRKEGRPFSFKGYDYKPYMSEVTGAEVPAWGKQPKSFEVRLFDEFEPGLVVTPPPSYGIPAQWKEVIELVKLHGFKYKALQKPLSGLFETYRFQNVSFATAPFEGRHMPQFRAILTREQRTLPAGSVIVSTAQVGAKLLTHMLEPDGPDSLVRWGLFNAVFEQKEYFETHAMEPIARRMLENDPALKEEFEERLKDPEFAKSREKRLQFFYERSPYADVQLNKYPVVRLSSPQ